MVQWIVGIIYGGFMVSAMMISVVLIAEQIGKWFKNK
jgi:hypothetical protein